MQKIYEQFTKRNPYGFAHFFLAYFGALIATFALQFTPYDLVERTIVIGFLIMLTGLLYEIKQHGKLWFKVRDAREDMCMNLFGAISGIFVII